MYVNKNNKINELHLEVMNSKNLFLYYISLILFIL